MKVFPLYYLKNQKFKPQIFEVSNLATYFSAGVTIDVSRLKSLVSKSRVKSLGMSSLSCRHDLTESASRATSGSSL